MFCYASLQQSHWGNAKPPGATVHPLYDESNCIFEGPEPGEYLPILVHLTECTTEVMKDASSVTGREQEQDSSRTRYLRTIVVCFMYANHINVNW